MGSTGNGAKAGLVAGVAYGIVLGIVSYFTLLSIKSTVLADITTSLNNTKSAVNFTPDQVYNIALIVAPVFVIIVGVIGGLILGAIYGKLLERIPGGTPLIKGVIFGIVLWLLASVLLGLGNLGEYGAEYYLTNVGTGLAGALIFGVLLGYFYGRFTKPKETYTMT
jgi:F0F1-type ATP synthase assembly protein I